MDMMTILNMTDAAFLRNCMASMQYNSCSNPIDYLSPPNGIGFPVLYRNSQWSITPNGVESNDGDYLIDVGRLWEFDGTTWENHLAEKNWVKPDEAARALRFARLMFADRPEARA